MKSRSVLCLPLKNEQDSAKFAAELAAHLLPPLTIGFSGEIGMGKTTLIRFLFIQMGITTRIKSPTFSLVETYQIPNQEFFLHHFDLYRIHDESELDYIGFRDYFATNTICCIEWPEQLGDYSLDLDILISLSRQGEGREMVMQAFSVSGEEVLNSIKGTYGEPANI